MVRDDAFADLQDELGYHFADPELLRHALRHGSSAAAAMGGSYERLEFLGDAVLGHALARILFERFPRADQGKLTRMRSHLARSVTLSQKATLIGLDGFVELGASEERTRGRERYSLLEDVFEATVAAIALDGGWSEAFAFVSRVFLDDIDDLDERTLAMADPKTTLQQEAQARGVGLPEYRQVGRSGPDHSRRWTYQVLWDGEEVARGEGKSKREAQVRAARRALVRLGLVPE